MIHAREFDSREPSADQGPDTPARVLAIQYARVFLSDEGQAVLKDLEIKFSHKRQRFPAGGRPEVIRAAVIDGECNVLREIENGIKAGRPFAQISTDSQPKNK